MLLESSIFLYLEFDVTFLSLSLRMYIFTNYALQYIYILFRCNSIFRDHHVRTISNISTEQNDRFRGPNPRTSNTLSLFSRKKQKQKCFFFSCRKLECDEEKSLVAFNIFEVEYVRCADFVF